MHYLYHDVIEKARHNHMTDGEREAQLISRVYGNIHLENPDVTRELVRQRLLLKKAREEANGKTG